MARRRDISDIGKPIGGISDLSKLGKPLFELTDFSKLGKPLFELTDFSKLGKPVFAATDFSKLGPAAFATDFSKLDQPLFEVTDFSKLGNATVRFTAPSAFTKMGNLYGDTPALSNLYSVQASFATSVSELVGRDSAFAKSMAAQFGPGSAFSKSIGELHSTGFKISKVVEQSRKSLDSIAGHQHFADSIGALKPFSEIASMPSISSFVGTATMPSSAWVTVVDALRPAIGDELHDEVAAEFEVASEAAGDGATWWIARVPLHTQLVLLVFVLQALDAAGKFLEDVTGTEVPPAYHSGAQLLFALAFVLMAFIDAEADAALPVEDDDSTTT